MLSLYLINLLYFTSIIFKFCTIAFFCFCGSSADAETDLLQATHQDNFDAVRDFVLAKVDLSQCDQQGNNVVHYAARSGNVQLLEVNKLFRPPSYCGEMGAYVYDIIFYVTDGSFSSE